ncbi:MAG TPA: DUF885 domain-containing protein [Vicinamibacterales bacterium]|nr:DUF885 domain-containing protein [Vicinamibacterales bacterium]
MSRRILLTAAALVLALCTAPDAQTPAPTAQPVAAQDETARLNAWFEKKFEEQLAFSPIQQTFLGRHSNAIDDMSIAGKDAVLAWQRASVAELRKSFDYAKLTPEAQTSYDVWVYQLTQAEAALPFRDNAYVFEQMNALHTSFPQLLIAFHSVATPVELDAYINRIRETGRAIRQLLEISKSNAGKGVRPPRFAFDFVIDESQKIITGAPFDDSGADSPVWSDVKTKVAELQKKGALDEARATKTLADARAALTGPFRSAYQELIAWQKQDRENAPATAAGVSALPSGTAYYNERLANQTTTTMTADAIHKVGLAEVTRLRAEMMAVKDEVGFKGDLPAFFAELRNNKDNPRYYYPDTDEGRQAYIADATAAINKIKAVLPKYFGILPKADLVVRRVEPFREQPGAAQHYFPSTPDGARPGVYYAHLSDMKAMPKHELEVIAYHEGLPGHHMQIAIAQELTTLPTFRRQAGFGAYAEGWGLYSEWLAREMPGTYTDPYSRFGRLGSEMWRAIRLVVDTGLHAKGWSQEQAVQYFMANSATTEGQARSEVRRYLVLPGQATSYKIGMLKIQELRRKAEAALGARFDIRAFHDVVLGGGALPLTILEKRVDRWIAERRSKGASPASA